MRPKAPLLLAGWEATIHGLDGLTVGLLHQEEFVGSFYCQPWRNKPQTAVELVPLNYQIMTIGGVPPPIFSKPCFVDLCWFQHLLVLAARWWKFIGKCWDWSRLKQQSLSKSIPKKEEVNPSMKLHKTDVSPISTSKNGTCKAQQWAYKHVWW